MNQPCTACNVMMSCSADQHCWCSSLPHALPVINDNLPTACLCKNCLAKKISEQINTLIAGNTLAEMLIIAKPYKGLHPLNEHIDYNLVNDLYEFTTWFHLKRGTCCKNNCKNCPY